MRIDDVLMLMLMVLLMILCLYICFDADVDHDVFLDVFFFFFVLGGPEWGFYWRPCGFSLSGGKQILSKNVDSRGVRG